MRVFLIGCLAALGAAGPAFADAVVYSGTIGQIPVILELTSPPGEGAVEAARYAYLSKGVDIPLRGIGGQAEGTLRFEEEKPCTPQLCGSSETSIATDPPIAADWTLAVEAGGKRLSGTWRDRASGKMLPLAFTRRAERPIDITNYSPLESLDPGNAPIEHDTLFAMSPQDYPYDFAKLDWRFEHGQEMRLGQGIYRLDKDKRVGVAYPIVVSLGDVDVEPLNLYLVQQRLQYELPAFRCLSSAYLGFGWNDIEGQGSTGYDGEVTASVDHLSPRLMGLTEGGSYWCGGAHPDNFITHRLVDARSGDLIMPETLLRGWIARNSEGAEVDPATYEGDDFLSYSPSEELVAFVREHRQKLDADTEATCGIDDLIASNLGIYFKQDRLVFTLKDLPHVIFACTNDLLEVPLEEARPLLTEKGARYFAELDR